jgi:Gpi18-like mannosyltransferase
MRDPDDRIAAAPREARLWWALLFVAALVRAAIMPYGGFPTDIGAFKSWAAALAERGPAAFYGRGFADYLPGYLYVLWAIGELHAYLRFSDQALLFLIKLPAAIADLLGAALLRRIARSFVAPAGATAVAVLYLFHPALVFTGAYWGQADSVGAALALLALALFQRGHPLAWSAAAAAFIVKPQTGPLAAVLGVALLRRVLLPSPRPAGFRPRPDLAVAAALIAGGTLLLITAPFRVGPAGLVMLLRNAMGVYPYGSVVAFNLWGAVQGFWRSDAQRLLGLPLYAWGTIATLLAMAVILAAVWRRPTDRMVVLGAAAALAASFLLPTRIHERYLIPALPFLALAPAVDRRMWGPYLTLSVLLLFNLVYAYTRPAVQTFLLPSWIEGTLFAEATARAMSAAATAVLPWILWILWPPRRGVWPQEESGTTP